MNKIIWLFVFLSAITMNCTAQKSAIVKNVIKSTIKNEDKKLVKASKLASKGTKSLPTSTIARTYREGDCLLKNELTDIESKLLASELKSIYGNSLDITPAFAKQLYQICVKKGKKSYGELFDIMKEYREYAKLKIGDNKILKLERIPNKIMDVKLTPNLSLVKWFHIALRHGEKINNTKTHFAKEFMSKLPKEIEHITKNETNFIGQQKNGNKLYYKYYEECIGYDSDGEKMLNYIMVVTYKDGKICTSYPVTESKIQKTLGKMSKLNSH